MAQKKITPAAIVRARTAADLSQSQAAPLVGAATNTWSSWEQGRYPMAPAIFELFLLKTGQFTVRKKISGNANYPTILELKLASGQLTELKLSEEQLQAIGA